MRFTVRAGEDPVAVADGSLLRALGLPSGGIVRVGRTHLLVKPAVVPANELRLGPEALANVGVAVGSVVEVVRVLTPDARHVGLRALDADPKVLVHALQGRPLTAGDSLTIAAGYRTDEGPAFTVVVTTVEPQPGSVVRGSTRFSAGSTTATPTTATPGPGPDPAPASGLAEPPVPTTRSALLAGLDTQRELLAGWLALLTRSDLTGAWGLPAVAGVVVEGPAGCGRSELVSAAAEDAGATVSAVDVSSVFKPERLLDRLAAAVNTASAPSVLFVDHIDAIIGSDALSTFRTQYLAVLRWFLDTLTTKPGVACVLGVERSGGLDPSLLATNLLPRTLTIPPPDLERRRQLFAAALRSVPTEAVDPDRLAALSAGFSGADIVAAVLQASATVANTGAKVTAEIAEAAVRGTAPSLGSVPLGEVAGVGFDKVANLTEVKQRLTEAVIWPLKDPGRFARLGIDPPRGILLFGPPGTGKTFVVKALAHEAGAAFFSVKGAELLDKYVGESERAVREVFARARSTAPSIIFFDEFDALAPVRGRSATTVSDSVVASLLTELDGLTDRGAVAVVAATNRRDLIDPALLRAGRFETQIYLGLPDHEARLAMLAISDVPLAPGVTTGALAEATEGLSFADISGVLREAALQALRADETASVVGQAHLDAALLRWREARQGDPVNSPDPGPGSGAATP